LAVEVGSQLWISAEVLMTEVGDLVPHAKRPARPTRASYPPKPPPEERVGPAWTPKPGLCNGDKRQPPWGLCTRPAGWATEHVGIGHCKFHFGDSPPHRKKAQREITMGRIGEALSEVGIDVTEVDYIEGLASVVRLDRAMVAVLKDEVSRLHELHGPDHSGDGRPHVLVDMLAQWSAMQAKNEKLALDAGIEERRLAIDTRYAEAFTTGMRVLLDAMRVALVEAGLNEDVMAAVYAERSAAMFESSLDAASRALETGGRA